MIREKSHNANTVSRQKGKERDSYAGRMKLTAAGNIEQTA